MKGHRWFVLALCFLLLNGYAVFRWLGGQRNTGTVRVALVAPEGGRVKAGSTDVIRWSFTADMVPTNQVGQWRSDGPVRLLPEVAGKYSWTAANELSFRPDSEWPPCTLYSAVMSENLRSTDGRLLGGEPVSAFFSTPLTLLDIRQSSLPVADRLSLDFEFNAPVTTEDLAHFLNVETIAGQAVKVHGMGTQGRNTVRVYFELPQSDELSVMLGKGLSSSAGTLGLEQDEVRPLRISRELKVLRINTDSEPFESGKVLVSLNAPVDPVAAKEYIRIRPEMEFAVETRDSWSGRQNLRILGDFKAGENYRITFCKGLSGEKEIRLEKDDTRRVYFPPNRPAVEFTARGTYLSTQGNLSIPLKAVNTGTCSVRIRRIYANNLVQLAARETGRAGYYYGSHNRGLDQLVGEFDLPIDAAANETVERSLELRPWLAGQTGVFHVEVSGERGGGTSQEVIISDLGISLRQSGRDMLVWVNSIRSLDAVEGATVEIYSEENQLLLCGETDGDGLVRLDPTTLQAEGDPFLVVVQRDDDLTCMRLDNSSVDPGGSTGSRGYLEEGYEAYLFTDRGIYRPGETVHVEAVVRGRDALCPESFPLELVVIRPDGKTDRTLSGLLGEKGSAEFEVPLADYVATGRYQLRVRLPGSDSDIGVVMVSVEEFVPPQIRTSLKVPEGRIAAGDPFGFVVAGQHLFGRTAFGLTSGAQVEFMPCAFAPEAWATYAFGDARRLFETIHRSAGRKVLDAEGEAEYSVETSAQWKPPAAVRAVVVGTVQETGGRTVSAYGSRTVDVYPSYIGIRRPDELLETGGAHSFDLVVVLPDGSLRSESGSLQATIEKLNWVTVMRREGDHYAYRSEEQAVEIESHDVTLVDGRAAVEFAPGHAGRYRLVVEHPQNGTASSLEFSVCAPGQRWDERSMSAPDRVELELDRKAYQVGDAARLSIRSPFAGKALLTVESDNILLSRVMTLTNNAVEIELPVEAAYRPNVYCSVSVVRPALPEEIWGQHRAAGRIPLIVEQPERKLEIAMELPEQIRPGTRLEIPLQVRDAAGAGCSSEVVLAAVDEGICMLTGFKTPDPFDYFFGPRLPAVRLHDLYARLMPETIDRVAGGASAPGGGMFAALGKRINPIKARRFKPVALWSSSLATDSNGQARVVFDVPEFTGELRIMAVAIDRSRFGSAAQPVQVIRPLIVQSSLPRFLAPDDVFTMPVRLFNETKQDGEVRVRVDCEGPLKCDEPEQRVWVAAGNATNLQFQLHASAVPGKAVCRLNAELGEERYEEPIEIAVRPAVPRVVRSGSNRIAARSDRTIALPSDWLKGTGEATLWLSSMPSVQLGGSLEYLINYPYGCLEQTTSKSFPLLYLSALVEQMRPGWLGEDGTREFVGAGIYRILSMQKGNGGFSLWPQGDVYQWGSIYATHFLVEASKAGYDVPKERLDEALDFVEQKARNASFNQAGLDYDTSYACFVLALGGRPQHGTVARLCEQGDALDYDTRINVIAALLAAGQRRQAVELLDASGQLPTAPLEAETGGSLRSEVRGTAFLLSVLLEVDPESREIPALARKLEAAQKNGCWWNTQDNAMAIMVLGKYTARFAEQQKPITGRVSWNSLTKTVSFADRDELCVPLESFIDKNVRIENYGEGDLFLYWKSEGIPLDGDVEESDRGIRIRRTLLDGEGVPADPATLKQGELYVVELKLQTGSRIENLVIEDLLPAGLEVENGALKTAQSVSWTKQRQTLPMQHLDIRDDRVIAFPGTFSDERTYCYAVRAVTAGEFVWPAVSAECMYNPSIKSVHGKGRIRVVTE